jgi:hypothetical protein
MFNVLRLGALIARAQQQHQRCTILPAVHAVAGACVDAQLEYARSN